MAQERMEGLCEPNEADYSVTWWYLHGKPIAVRRGLRDISLYLFVENFDKDTLPNRLDDIAGAKEVFFDHMSYLKAQDDYKASIEDVIKLFKQSLFRHLSIEDHPKRDVLFELSFQRALGDFEKTVAEAEELAQLL